MKHQNLSFLVLLCLTLLASCKPNPSEKVDTEQEGSSPVTLVHPVIGEMEEIIELNAVTSFQMKTFVKANMSGYLEEVDVKPGDFVTQGQPLFGIQSKESAYLGKTVQHADTSFHYDGLNILKSPVHGYITQLNSTPGNFVQEGDVLAILSDLNSLVIHVEIPFELKEFLSLNKNIRFILPDDKIISGTLMRMLPIVDPVSQTQTFVYSLPASTVLPENLTVRAQFIKKIKEHAVRLPLEAILTNELQQEFWVMKMTDSTTAVKVPVIKGMESNGCVEILSPAFKSTDLIVLSGNYGLDDTASVHIEKDLK